MNLNIGKRETKYVVSKLFHILVFESLLLWCCCTCACVGLSWFGLLSPHFLIGCGLGFGFLLLPCLLWCFALCGQVFQTHLFPPMENIILNRTISWFVFVAHPFDCSHSLRLVLPRKIRFFFTSKKFINFHFIGHFKCNETESATYF